MTRLRQQASAMRSVEAEHVARATEQGEIVSIKLRANYTIEREPVCYELDIFTHTTHISRCAGLLMPAVASQPNRNLSR